MLGRFDDWQFYLDTADEWRWTRTARGVVVGKATEGYVHRRDCEDNAARLGWGRCNWPESARRDWWTFYVDNADRWRWRRQARNNEIVGAAHMGFATRGAMQANARRHGWQLDGHDCAAAAPSEWGTCSG